jgi:flagellar basal-body rod protein FlgB
MFNFNHSQTFEALTTALDGLDRRQKILANNIANQNTPGFQARELDFSHVMTEHVAGRADPDADLAPVATSAGHQGPLPEAASDAWDHATRVTAGAFNLQDQMVALGQTSLHYSAIAQTLSQKMAMYRQVITEGKR